MASPSSYPPPSRDPALWALAASSLALMAVTTYFARLYHFNVVDDAYISFQYAKNLATGRGLVFNPGERVEGYTNFLWVIALCPFYALSRALHFDFTRFAIGFNQFIAVLDLGLIYLVGRKLLKGSLAIALALLLCVLDDSYQGYAISGLENHLVTLWMLAAVFAWLSDWPKRWLWTGLFFALANMTRPDAALFPVTFGAAHVLRALWIWKPMSERNAQLRAVLRSLGVWAAVFGLYFLARWAYYGQPLPNTFYLKVGGTFDALTRGWKYTEEFLENRYHLPVVALVAVAWALEPVVLWLVLFMVGHMAYISYVGGDFYSGHRFYVVLLPVISLLVARVAQGIAERVERTGLWDRLRSSRATVGIVYVTVGLAAATGLVKYSARSLETGPYTREIVAWGEAVNKNVRYMKWLGTHAAPGSSMVVGDIGAAGFFADLTVVDVYGVVDPVIAHQRVASFGKGKAGHEKVASRDYLLARKTTYVKWGYLGGDLTPFGYYVFTDFPPGIFADGLWVKEDLTDGDLLPQTAIHFNPKEVSGWQASGTAFSTYPTTSPVRGQLPVFGQVGSYVDSFTAAEGDRATGRLVSPPFPLVGDKLLLRVGGGRDPQRLRVSLLIEGAPVYSATGHDAETLGRRVWHIDSFRGQTGQIEIVDEATGHWGHLLVDEIVQWKKRD